MTALRPTSGPTASNSNCTSVTATRIVPSSNQTSSSKTLPPPTSSSVGTNSTKIVKKQRKQRRKKVQRDDRKPVRPLTAFLYFLQESRQSILEELKDPVTGKAPLAHEVSKHAGKLWREINDEQKSKFEKLAADAKEAYSVKLEEYKKLLSQGN